MRTVVRAAIIATALQLGSLNLFAQTPNCPVRQSPGTLVQNPLSLSSQNGVLQVDLALRNGLDPYGFMHYCYDYSADSSSGRYIEAPTLRLNPGDELILNLANRITPSSSPAPDDMSDMGPMPGIPGTDCTGGTITDTDTNLHFHGLNVPPVCHQDDVLSTVIHTGDPPFQFKIQIPANEPPGLYWYHPHAHGFTTTQVEGGASGALIVNGIEKVWPQVAGLQERVLILRQQFYNQNSWIPGPFQYTLNFQTSSPGLFPLPLIAMEPGKKEFWRFLNSCTQGFVTLQVRYSGVNQPLELLSLDGVPLTKPEITSTILVPPAGRAEFIVAGPQPGISGQFWTAGVDTGPLGNPNPPNPIANIITTSAPAGTAALTQSPALPDVPQRFADLATAVPTAKRTLYFSEITVNPTTVKFFITVEGQKPRSFSANEPPAIVTHVGAVEEWTVENRAEEEHAFHIHQIHFLVLAQNGKPLAQPVLQDTIALPAWSGKGPYPNVTLLMDFRDPEIAGTFVYHCHILDHEDAGMMAKILVKPAGDGGQASSASAAAKSAALRKGKRRESGL
jgi:FtsP/CotA-like multicopper oxidase with cupredoxin domain